MSENFLGKPAKSVEDFILGGNVIDYEGKGVVFEPYELVKSKGDVLDQNFCISGDFSKIKRIKKLSRNFKIIQNDTFSENDNINYVDLDGIHTIGSDAFSECYNLSVVNSPNVSSISEYAFFGCENLISINVSNVQTIEGGVFENCFRLSLIECQCVSTINWEAFTHCQNLSSIRCPNVTSIGYNAFKDCKKLSTIDFSERTLTTIPVIDDTNAFSGIPSDYEIRVPNSLYDEWIKAEKWSSLSSHIVAV